MSDQFQQRLAAPMGLLIDRNKQVDFQFEGKSIQGFAGDSIASALLANQGWLLSRSFKYHRPRGPLTMAGQDANTLVQLESEPNILADRQLISSGLKVSGQNYTGTLEKDSDAYLGYLGRFMPVGFYYRCFFKPLGAWHRWEKFLRKKAGLGKLNLAPKGQHYFDKKYLFCDVLVVGAGPAGMQSALRAAQAGAKVLLVDEQRILGGSLTYHRFAIASDSTASLLAELSAKVSDHANIQILLEATCNGWFTDNYLPVIQDKRLYKVRAKECIVASGAYEQHVVFRNNDLPGVVMCSAVSRMLKHYAIRPAKAAIILTGNDNGYLTALDLAEQQITVVAIVDMRSAQVDSDILNAVTVAGIEVIQGSTVYEALATKGNKHVRGVDIRAIVAPGQVARSARLIDCDLLCMSAGYMPAYQLLCQAGGQLSYSDEISQFKLSHLPEHLHVAGSVNAIHSIDKVLEDGDFAAQNALLNLGLVAPQSQLSVVTCHSNHNFPWPIFSHPKGKDFVDFDEDLQAADIINATKLGYRDIQLVKRFSTVGMGPSQGRHSALPTARLVAKATARSVTQTGITTSRPPFSAETLAHNAGRNFNPVKHTAMHRRHIALGAHLIAAGAWQRPAFYGKREQRDQLIQAEALNVRNNVGLIDVSTLGGIELRGPDAAEFINRIYTFGFIKQPVGKTRYAVLTSEQGVVVDDGVACRISDTHFYVTATTTGVDNVYRSMLKWNVQWRLNVDIANVTSAFSAVNLAGPNARKVLEKLVFDTNLSSADFPFLACRQATVASIPARLLRVGFVGELGYEIHVPSRYGEALWDHLMRAGEEFGIQPFGVEAQRLLRLEKGHIIVSQDTDGMSHPGELSLKWAVNRKKPFFIGCRSVDIVMQQKQTRKLVGFTVDSSLTHRPKEGHLVIAGDDVSGNVTSCEYSSSLDQTIGLAFVGTAQSDVGSTFTIRTDDGQLVSATVVALPFFDPDNLRQGL